MAFSNMALRGAAILAVLAVVGCKTEGEPDATIVGRAVVMDGDTLEIGAHRVRLSGVDAPEYEQVCQDEQGDDWSCGAAAAARLAHLIGGRDVICTPRDRDRYDRIVADCSAGDVNLGARLVAEGLAWAYLQYSDEYRPAEDYARAQNFGVWRGAAQVAWEYRAEGWTSASGFAPASTAAPDAACAIKGNINPNGERIYHMPGTPWYDKTRIDETRGQRWFCDEAEAQAAGWRPVAGLR